MIINKSLFLSHVDVRGPDECWLWELACDKNGYGLFTVRIKGQWRKRNSHRVAYIIANGTISNRVCVLHTCDNPPCCNPNHLFKGTHQDNMLDRDRKGRSGSAKLREADVREIFTLYNMGNWTYEELRVRYGLFNEESIGRIIRRKTWRHVPI